MAFTSNISGGTGTVNYDWTFGDGSKDSGAAVNHTFVAAGTYAVSLWVNDTGGGSVEKVLNLTVGKPAAALAGALGEFGPYIAVFAAIVVVAIALLLLARRRKGRTSPAEEPLEAPPSQDSNETPPEGVGGEFQQEIDRTPPSDES